VLARVLRLPQGVGKSSAMLHFRADVQAVTLGTNVANFAAANYFESVGNH
jgi:hypothetical protein